VGVILNRGYPPLSERDTGAPRLGVVRVNAKYGVNFTQKGVRVLRSGRGSKPTIGPREYISRGCPNKICITPPPTPPLLTPPYPPLPTPTNVYYLNPQMLKTPPFTPYPPLLGYPPLSKTRKQASPIG
jgi:hypothetical protein